MKILVTGARGMLGTEICRELRLREHDVISTDVNRLEESSIAFDICDTRQANDVFSRHRPEMVFHLAAETNVDYCEQNPDHAYRVNALGTENMALACAQYDLPMIYISTAGVFNGEKIDPYTEFDQPDPINVYGHTKLAGEHVVQGLLKKYVILRAGWMIGGWDIDKKFVFKIVQQINQGSRVIKAVNDKFGSPTFTRHFARQAIQIMDTRRWGLFHLCGGGSCSRYELARKIVDCLGIEKKIAVEPIASAQFPLSAPRPRSEAMRNYKLDLLQENGMPHWTQALEEYLGDYCKNNPALVSARGSR